MGEILRHCLNCDFSRERQLIGPDGKLTIGQKIHTCHRFPPTPVLLPSAEGGTTLTPCFPIVNEGISCAEHRFPIVNEGISCAEHRFPDGEGSESDDVPGDLKVN